MDYIELIIGLPDDQLLREIITAELAEIGLKVYGGERTFAGFIPASELTLKR